MPFCHQQNSFWRKLFVLRVMCTVYWSFRKEFLNIRENMLFYTFLRWQLLFKLPIYNLEQGMATLWWKHGNCRSTLVGIFEFLFKFWFWQIRRHHQSNWALEEVYSSQQRKSISNINFKSFQTWSKCGSQSVQAKWVLFS